MTYTAKENSTYDGQPNELYQFVRNGQSWRYTSADEDKTIESIIYSSASLTRTKLEQNQEMSRNPITVSIDKNASFVQQFRGAPPSDVIQLTIFRYHEGDSEVVTIWIGRVVNIRLKERIAEIRCEPIFTAMKRPVLRRRYQTTCPHVLYGAQCGVLSSSFSVITSLLSVSGTTLTASAFGTHPDGYFSGGYVEWEVDGNIETRPIINHVGTAITVNFPFQGMPSNATVKAFPGCDHVLATCNTKFNNVENYGGQPFFPSKNPMNGTTIY